ASWAGSKSRPMAWAPFLARHTNDWPAPQPNSSTRLSARLPSSRISDSVTTSGPYCTSATGPSDRTVSPGGRRFQPTRASLDIGGHCGRPRHRGRGPAAAGARPPRPPERSPRVPPPWGHSCHVLGGRAGAEPDRLVQLRRLQPQGGPPADLGVGIVGRDAQHPADGFVV